MKNAIAAQNTCFATNQTYDWTYPEKGPVMIERAEIQTKFVASKGNTLYVSQADCVDGSSGYFVGVTNSQIEDAIQFNSCTDGTVQKGVLADPASN